MRYPKVKKMRVKKIHNEAKLPENKKLDNQI